MTKDNLDFLLRGKLIQQTPYIHFQHDQDGAILRTTEVKPELDEFILRKMGGKENKDTMTSERTPSFLRLTNEIRSCLMRNFKRVNSSPRRYSGRNPIVTKL